MTQYYAAIFELQLITVSFASNHFTCSKHKIVVENL